MSHDQLAVESALVELVGTPEALLWLGASTRLKRTWGAPKPSVVQLCTALKKKKGATVAALDALHDVSELQTLLRAARAAKSPGVFLSFFNQGSTQLVLRAMGGHGVSQATLADEEVARVAAAEGYEVMHRQAFQGDAPAMAADTIERIGQLLKHLTPSAQDDRVVYHLRAIPRALPPPALVPGRVSVIMRNHSLSRLSLIDQALFSIACQHHADLEVVLVSQSLETEAHDRLTELLKRHQLVGRYTYQCIMEPSNEDIRARLVNIGVKHATGQYVAFLDDDDVVYPEHYARAVQALAESDHAWAFARVRRAYFQVAGDGILYCLRKDFFPRSEDLDLFALMYDNYVTCHSYVIDRFRTASVPIAFEEQLTKNEDYVFLLRLLAAFRPLALGEHATVEYRIRDDGTNTILNDALSEKARARVQAEWESAIRIKNQLCGDLTFPITQAEAAQEAAQRSTPPRSEARELRYKLADAANTLIKRVAPVVHTSVRKVIATVDERARKR